MTNVKTVDIELLKTPTTEETDLSKLNDLLRELLESIEVLNTRVMEVSKTVDDTLTLAEKLDKDIEQLTFEIQYPGLDEES